MVVPDARRQGFEIGFCLRRARGVRERVAVKESGPTPSPSPRAALRLNERRGAGRARHEFLNLGWLVHPCFLWIFTMWAKSRLASSSR